MSASLSHTGMVQSFQIMVVRGVVNSDTAYLSNVRALPTGNDLEPSPGIRGFVSYPPALPCPTVPADVATYLADLSQDYHEQLNLVTAGALLGVPLPLLTILRGDDPQRPGKLFASIVTDERFDKTPSVRVGTSDHLETHGLNDRLPHKGRMGDLTLRRDSGNLLWAHHVFPRFGCHVNPFAAGGAGRVPEAFASALTGFNVVGTFGPLEDPDVDLAEVGKLVWMFPISVDGMKLRQTPTLELVDFSRMASLDNLLAVWDPLMTMVSSGLYKELRDQIASEFSPLVKDLIRWASYHHPLGDASKNIYKTIWRSESLIARDSKYLAPGDFPWAPPVTAWVD